MWLLYSSGYSRRYQAIFGFSVICSSGAGENCKDKRLHDSHNPGRDAAGKRYSVLSHCQLYMADKRVRRFDNDGRRTYKDYQRAKQGDS